jgi:uracil-DNA glycosylase family 4
MGEVNSFTLTYKNNLITCPTLPGHIWNYDPLTINITGAQPAEVMLINKLLYQEDLDAGGVMWGATGLEFADELFQNGIDCTNWYVTNYVKMLHPDAAQKNSTVTAGMNAEFKPLLFREMAIVQPDVIICLGADVASAVLDKKTTLKKIEETVQKIQLPLTGKVADVIAIPHPHAAKHSGNSSNTDAVSVNIKFLAGYFGVNGSTLGKSGVPKDYRTITSLEQYEALAKEINETCEHNLIAIDAEWNGEHPQNANFYVRCLQLAWAENKAACIALAPQTQDCDLATRGYYNAEQLAKLVKITESILKGKRVAGHFIEADMEGLSALGLDLQPYLEVPDSPEAFYEQWNAEKPCGFDTGRAVHSIDESADFSLKAQARIYTDVGRYDKELDDWIEARTTKSLKPVTGKIRMDGYGIIPDELLYKYGCYDADVTRQLALIYGKMLDRDNYGNNCWKPFWIAMRALPAIFEINQIGMLVDRERLQSLTTQYQQTADNLLQEIRTWAKWEDFNPRSPFQMRELLFGEQYNGKHLSATALKKWQKENNLPETARPPGHIRIRPEGAKTMGLTPIITTDKYPQQWSKIAQAGQEHLYTASTNKDVLAQLSFFQSSRTVNHQGALYKFNYKPILDKLRYNNVISQTLRYVLKPPVDTLDSGGEPVFATGGDDNNDSDFVYDSGIPSYICDDNRIRTHIYPTKKTGRWGSARPAMQNLGKLIEEQLKEILHEDYKHPLRSIFIPSPGCVFVEADYIGAEIAAAAYMCNDEALLEHCRRNQLPESDPEYYDIHSHIAVEAFKLDCEPSKKGLASIGKSYLRIIAKAILFGLFYGRSAPAIAEEARSQGIEITAEEARQVIDQIQIIYPKLLPYFAACEQRIHETGWIANAFGRYRRFPQTTDQDQKSRFGRQGKNFPIQSLVADAINCAVYHLKKHRDELQLKSKIVLSIHDAILMEVPYDEVKIVYETLLPKAMIANVPIISSNLDGSPLDYPPRYLGIDVEVYSAFGVKLKDLTPFNISI